MKINWRVVEEQLCYYIVRIGSFLAVFFLFIGEGLAATISGLIAYSTMNTLRICRIERDHEDEPEEEEFEFERWD